MHAAKRYLATPSVIAASLAVVAGGTIVGSTGCGSDADQAGMVASTTGSSTGSTTATSSGTATTTTGGRSTTGSTSSATTTATTTGTTGATGTAGSTATATAGTTASDAGTGGTTASSDAGTGGTTASSDGGREGGTTDGGAICDTLGALTPPTVPAALTPPAGATLALRFHADGSQIYTCTGTPAADAGSADAAGDAAAVTYAWKFKAPEAILYDAACSAAVHHFAGPTWKSNADSSSVVGSAQASVAQTGTIAWLLLKAATTTGEGIFTNVSAIQRVDTVGGSPPTTACDSTNANVDQSVHYTATYYFYTGGTWPTEGGAGEGGTAGEAGTTGGGEGGTAGEAGTTGAVDSGTAGTGDAAQGG